MCYTVWLFSFCVLLNNGYQFNVSTNVTTSDACSPRPKMCRVRRWTWLNPIQSPRRHPEDSHSESGERAVPSTSRSMCRLRVDLWATTAAAVAEPLTVRQQPTASHTQPSMFEHCPSLCPSVCPSGRPCSSVRLLPIATWAACARRALIIHLARPSLFCSPTSLVCLLPSGSTSAIIRLRSVPPHRPSMCIQDYRFCDNRWLPFITHL